MSKTGKILSLSSEKIAAILTVPAAFLSFSALVWISESPPPEPEPPPVTQRDPAAAPVLPVTALPASGLEGLGALPPMTPRR